MHVRKADSKCAVGTHATLLHDFAHQQTTWHAEHKENLKYKENLKNLKYKENLKNLNYVTHDV